MAKTYIPDGILPSDQSYRNLKGHGIHKDFVDWELPNFIDYWLTARDEAKTEAEKKDAKKSRWQVALQNWMKMGFHGSAGKRYEEIRHLRRDSGSQGDIFAATLDKIKQPPDTPKPQSTNVQPIRVIHSPIPGADLGPIDTEDALEQLRRFGK